MSEPTTPTFVHGAPHLPPVKSPIRFSIMGKQHLIAQLQEIVASAPDVTPEYKALIQSEIAKRTSNAAKVDLHVVDQDNGDTAIAIHIKQINLG